jgi:hypothetical protein
MPQIQLAPLLPGILAFKCLRIFFLEAQCGLES